MEGDDANKSASESRRFFCTQCDRSFLRREHLRRHAAVHAPSGAFTCSVCFKKFTRNDILMRHEATHSTATNGRKQKGLRSCAACVAARTKCSSTLPCARCVSKKIECHPQAQTRRNRTGTGNDSPFSPESSSSIAAIDSMSPVANGYSTPQTNDQSSVQDTAGAIFMPGPIPSPEQSTHKPFDPHNQNSALQEVPDLALVTVDNERLDGQIGDFGRPLDASITALSTDSSRMHYVDESFASATAPQSRELYIDSGGARLPKIRRTNSMRDDRRRPRPPSRQQGLMSFPLSRPITPELEDDSLRMRTFMPQDTWDELRTNFEHYCLTPSSLFPSYTSSRFPSHENFNLMIAAYFDSFHQIVPLVHLPTLSLPPSNWILALGLASIGCHYLNGASKFQLVDAMHEFLQRALVIGVRVD